jgi:ankyrin repeat protein
MTIPLIYAINGKHKEAIILLLNNNADVNYRLPKTNDTPLHIACETNDLDMVSILLSYNANMKARNTRGEQPVLNCQRDIIKLMFNRGLHIETPVHPSGATMLDISAVMDDIPMMRFLLDHNAYVDSTDIYGQTPLYTAIRYKKIEPIKLLLQHGADVYIDVRSDANSDIDCDDGEPTTLIDNLHNVNDTEVYTAVLDNIRDYRDRQYIVRGIKNDHMRRCMVDTYCQP